MISALVSSSCWRRERQLAQRKKKNGNKAHQEEYGDDCEKLDHGEAGICRFILRYFVF